MHSKQDLSFGAKDFNCILKNTDFNDQVIGFSLSETWLLTVSVNLKVALQQREGNLHVAWT